MHAPRPPSMDTSILIVHIALAQHQALEQALQQVQNLLVWSVILQPVRN